MFISPLLPTVMFFLRICSFAVFVKIFIMFLSVFGILYPDNDFVRIPLELAEAILDPMLAGIHYILPWTVNYNISLGIIIIILFFLHMGMFLEKKEKKKEKKKLR